MVDSVESAEAARKHFESLLPVSYTDSLVVSAVYIVPRVAAERALQHVKLQPALLTRERAAVVVSLFDYRRSSIGPYRELSVGVLALPERQVRVSPIHSVGVLSSVGAWVVALPVTSDLACKAGAAVFGYPKTVMCINVHTSTSSCSVSVGEDASPVLRIQIPMLPGPRVPVLRLLTYSQLGAELLETKIPVRWFPRLSAGRGARIELTQPEHALSRAIVALELPAEPTFVLHGVGFKATLNRATPL